MSTAGDGDKRTVATDALLTLGTIIDDTQKRDAIHLAVEPVIAGEGLNPGDHVKVVAGVAHRAHEDDGLGIVDPFLPDRVRKGQRFWFVMNPRTVHSLRHVWTHPAFPDADVAAVPPQDNSAKAQAERFIRDYAEDIGVGFNDLVQSAGEFLKYGEYMTRGGVLEGQSTSQGFWEQYSIYTGEDVPEEKRENFFSCSC